METGYHQLVEEARRLENPILSDLLRNVCPDARTFRRQGIQIYRDVLEDDDYRPSTLREILAFSALSRAIGRLLVKRGRLTEEDILSGLGTWRSSIAMPAETDVFDALAEALWPEAKCHLPRKNGLVGTHQEAARPSIDDPAVDAGPMPDLQIPQPWDVFADPLDAAMTVEDAANMTGLHASLFNSTQAWTSRRVLDSRDVLGYYKLGP